MNIFIRILWRLERTLAKKKLDYYKSIMKFVGENVRIDSDVNIIVPKNFSIGSNSSIASFTTIYATHGIKIGENCWISSNCGISSYNHVINSDNRFRDKNQDKYYSKPVIIGNNVWVGMNSCILPGITIGDNSVIGSGSVVTKDVPSNEIWVGNPARMIKKIDINYK
ncbi:acyltransferase [Flavobacterium rhizosphaerae]|uniref:Acyltransferase n=1 Tax=Flavobacterium rhizosphaerae TaxID=3163298 RepID=A0ABW8YXZ9_9FLAO